jgi:hypothetical protein
MNRRNFLMAGGVLAAALVVQLNARGDARSSSVEAGAQGKVYRGTADGRILVSADAGQTWTLHTAFGREFAVQGLSGDGGEQVRATLRYRGHAFGLRLAADGRRWLTA